VEAEQSVKLSRTNRPRACSRIPFLECLSNQSNVDYNNFAFYKILCSLLGFLHPLHLGSNQPNEGEDVS
jgi:hypothetical protein